MSARLDRINGDARWGRLWELGGVLHDRQRVARITAQTDWHRVLTPELEPARAIYARCVAPDKPLSDIHGWYDGRPFAVTREQLLAVWREQRSA